MGKGVFGIFMINNDRVKRDGVQTLFTIGICYKIVVHSYPLDFIVLNFISSRRSQRHP